MASIQIWAFYKFNVTEENAKCYTFSKFTCSINIHWTPIMCQILFQALKLIAKAWWQKDGTASLTAFLSQIDQRGTMVHRPDKSALLIIVQTAKPCWPLALAVCYTEDASEISFIAIYARGSLREATEKHRACQPLTLASIHGASSIWGEKL